MPTTITVYQSHNMLRVTAGEHKAHEGARQNRVSVYPSAKLAYAAETDPDVRNAILRIDPHAAPEPGDGPLGPIKPVTIPAGALAAPRPSRVRKPFKSMPTERLSEAREPIADPDIDMRYDCDKDGPHMPPAICAHPDGCSNRAAPGDVYCFGCRSGVESENERATHEEFHGAEAGPDVEVERDCGDADEWDNPTREWANR